MPSWNIHVKVAKLFGYREDEARLINELIDRSGPIHDFGRGIPNISRLRILIAFTFPELSFQYSLLSYDLSLLARYSDLFYLHHALDLLSIRLASSIITGLDIKERKEIVINSLIADLNNIYSNIAKFASRRFIYNVPHLSQDLLEKLNEKFDKIVSMKELLHWISSNVVLPKLENERRSLRDIAQELILKNEGYGKLLHNMIKVAALRSKFYDYAILSTSLGLQKVSQELFSIRKGLGKDIKSFFLGYLSDDVLKKSISSYKWLFKKKIPDNVINRYVDELTRLKNTVKEFISFEDIERHYELRSLLKYFYKSYRYLLGR